MKNKLIICATMLALFSVLNITNVSAVPVLIHEYNDIDVFHACAYYNISDFSTLTDFSENTLYTHSKNEVIGSVKNGLWEYEYIDPYMAQVVDKITSYTIKECAEDNKTMKIECKDVIYYNTTYKEEARYNTLWLDAVKLIGDSSKLSDIRLKSTQKVRFCADIERVWTPKGFTIKVDVIPQFNDFIYYSYAWWDDSYGFRYECESNATTNIVISCNGTSGICGNIYWMPNTTGIIYAYTDNSGCPSGNIGFATEDTQINWENESTRTGNNPEIAWSSDSGLYGVWHMVNESGIVYDSAAASNDMTITGTDIVEGFYGEALDFELDDNDGIASGNADMNWSDGLTVCAWFKYETPGSHFILEYRSGGTDNFYFYTTGAGQNHCPIISIRTSTGDKVGYCIDDINDNDWHYGCAVWDTVNLMTYIDGNLGAGANANISAGGTAVLGTAPLRIGVRRDGINNMDGIIDQVELYNESKSAAWVLDKYNSKDFGLGAEELFVPPPPPPIHSFIIYKLINLEIPFINWYLEALTFKAIIMFMDRLTVTGNVIIGGNLTVAGNITGGPIIISQQNITNNITFITNITNNITNINGTDIWLNSLGIGISSPSSTLEVNGTLTSRDIIPTTTDTYEIGDSTRGYDNVYVNNLYGPNFPGAATYTQIMTLDGTTAEIALIGRASPSINKFYPLTNNWDLGFSSNPAVSFRNLWLKGNLTIDVTDFFVDSSTSRVGIGTSSPSSTLEVNGNVDIGGNLNVSGNISGNDFYGETNMHPDGNITITINTQNVHENITGFNESKLNGFTLQGNDTLISQVSGRYEADFWVSSSGGVNRIYESCIAVNGEHATPHAHRKQGGGGDVGSMSGGGIIDLEVGDQINLQIRNADGTQDVDIFFAGMRFVRIGD